ncbi:MAG: GNAT family N-acetyltransferase [Burkholderiales bacterium]|nr:GNAT family N-acetyltransferase [Burkholderiales bacterium]MDE1926930.1 GNAT family N-acetyltransferase [Burkholderiales bacterium]MDE2157467.1 GNAT family N-acetyltransferase [Burkholderiales bacterium]MDE2501974.1 GNAT family N-acetyltransferase [Burkholderiales bacterium]
MARFIDTLEPRSRRLRFHGGIAQCPLALARRMTESDAASNRVWVACVLCDDVELIVAEARWVVVDEYGLHAELAICVADAWQGSGLADRLMAEILATAAWAQIGFLDAEVLAENGRMLAFMQRHGFDAELHAEDGDGIVRLCRPVCAPLRAPFRARAGVADRPRGLWHRLRAAGARVMPSNLAAGRAN